MLIWSYPNQGRLSKTSDDPSFAGIHGQAGIADSLEQLFIIID
ncbi:hypothetical protein [Paenibacillus sp. GP183]|nr:hypothetical protein [Paenibacillus sp. GP183]